MKMKNSILATIVIFCFIFSSYAQGIKGNITINDSSKSTIKMEDPYVVNLFKDFKTGKHQIKFSFKGDYSSKGEKPDFSFFTFKTTVKRNGKTIKSLARKPMPYLPGDMLIPVEAFDFIYVLSTIGQEGLTYSKNTGALPTGKYEIVLEATPISGEGPISKATIIINII